MKLTPNDGAAKLTLPQIMQQAAAAYSRGDWAEAERLCRRVLEAKADYFGALHLLGIVALQTQRTQEAAALFERAVAVNPNDASVHGNLGLALKRLKRLEEALDSYDRALKVRPDFVEAHNNRGMALLELNRLDEALNSYDRALQIKPDYVAAHNNRGMALKELKRLNEALHSYDRALQIDPDCVEAHNNRGVTLKELQRLDEALESYERALRIKPDYAEAHCNRGVVLSDLKRMGEALECHDRALQIKPDYAEAHSNRGAVLNHLQRLDEALESYDRALKLMPDSADVYWNRSLSYLLMGDFARGWEGLEWRWQRADFTSPKRNFTQPLWLGKESLAGRTILLHSEQGLGDALQFCRYAKPVSDLGARVLMEVPKPLVALLKNLAGVAQLIAKGEALPSFDYHCPLLSLPLAFNTDLNTIPAAPSYITSQPGQVAAWQARLGVRTRPRLGLVWSGSTGHENDHNRSLALAEMVKHLPHEYQYVSLQKEVRESDQAALEAHAEMMHFGEQLADFTDTAALCELMDLVISVDTSVAHLAGAMGKRVWILLPFAPDWRWLLDRADSPWYPSARLFRQHRIGDWSRVFEQVRLALQEQFKAEPGVPISTN